VSAPEIRLVVNADDFGMTAAISRGILRAHRDGIVTSTSLLGNCDDLAGARALLAEAPGLGVGVHLTLIGGRPVSDPAAVPSLLAAGGGGAFASGPQEFFTAWARGRIDAADIQRELDAQVGRARDAGLELDHLDTHRHLGFLPAVGRALEAVARRHGIAGIRSAVERPTLAWLADPRRGLEAGLLTGLAWLTRRQLGALRHGPQSWGYVETGRLDEVRVLEIIGRLGPGAHELICHPGEEDDGTSSGAAASGATASDAAPSADAAAAAAGEMRYHRARELAALASPKLRRALERRGIGLCRWKDLF
jgi:predicted glycoside hydrolase/deacetylase ChbG (UPF0249 family)